MTRYYISFNLYNSISPSMKFKKEIYLFLYNPNHDMIIVLNELSLRVKYKNIYYNKATLLLSHFYFIFDKYYSGIIMIFYDFFGLPPLPSTFIKFLGSNQ